MKHTVNQNDRYSDLEFIKLFKQFNKENIAMICDMISPPEKDIQPDICTDGNFSDEFVLSLNFLKNRIIKFSKNGGSNIILFNSPDDCGYSSKSLLQFTKLVVESDNPSVLVIDCNLRSPNLHTIMNVRPNYNLTDYVFGNKSVEDIIIDTKMPNVSLITSSIVTNPINLLLSERFIRLFDFVKSQFDFIIIHSPPYRNYVDTFILSKFISPIVLLVLKSENHAWKKAQDIRNELAVLDVKILGMIDDKK